tara:strand:- start:96 stop:311 length:216 start_codon:yes stop_codon:yes gene_type:complete
LISNPARRKLGINKFRDSFTSFVDQNEKENSAGYYLHRLLDYAGEIMLGVTDQSEKKVWWAYFWENIWSSA